MDFLEFLPALRRSLGNNLTVLGDSLEKSEEMAPFPTFKEDGVLWKGARENLFIIDPAKIRAIKVAVGNLELGPRARLSFLRVRARNLLLGNDLTEEFTPSL